MSTSPQGPRPARIITPAIRQRLQELLAKARRLSRAEPCPQGEIDDLMVECVTVDPGNTVYVGAFLHHLRRRDRPRRTGFQPVLSFLSRLAGNEPLHSIRSAADAQNWEEVLTLAPRALCQQPQSVELLRQLATACAATEHEQAELCYLQAAAALAPDDAETQRHLARALTRQGLFDDAAVAWKRLAEMLPEDEECQQTLNILCGYSPPPNAKGVLADDEERGIRNALGSGTASFEQIRELVEHLSCWRRLDDAERVLDQATVLIGPSLELRECREQLTIDRATTKSMIAWDLWNLRPDYRELEERTRDECVRVHVQIYFQKCEREPNNAELQLHLGSFLCFSGNYSEALKRLGPIARVPRWRAKALFHLGYTWERLKQLENALSCYQEATDAALGNDDEDTAAWTLQCAAILAQRAGKLDLARDLCNQMLSLSPTDEGRRNQHNFCRLMLDNLDRVCHNP